MNKLLWFINEVLNPIGILIGIVLAVPVFWTWWQVVFGERRQRRKWLAEISRNPGGRPGVLIVDLLPGKDIGASVRRYLANDPTLAGTEKDRIFTISRDAAIKPGQMADLARDIRAAARQLMDAGVDVVHLFHAGPDIAACMLGAELSNGPRVMLYHHEQGAYHCFGPLEPLR